MKRNLLTALFASVIIAAGAVFALTRQNATPSPAVATGQEKDAAVVAAPGRVEPISEEIRISAEVSGKLHQVTVEEGDRVERSQVIAQIENADYRARVASAQATLAEKEAELRRVVNGAREQERREALAAVKAAEAVRDNARLEAERRRSLFARGVVSREEAERFERAYRVAQAQYEEAVERHALIDAPAREEDRARAEANVGLARARLEEARALLEKTFIRAPVSGVVLRKQRKAGESVSTQFDSPIVTLADDSKLRVRIDVDETDVASIRLGQRAYVTADAFASRKFWGRVVRIGRLLGKKNIRTDEPTERVDTKILETLVELDDGRELPFGLRVDAFVLVGESPQVGAGPVH